MLTGLNVNNARHTGYATLHDFSTGQHLLHWTRSVAIEWLRLHFGLLQDMGHYSAPSLSFNANELK